MLEKRTLLVVFLKTLQVVGNIQEVLVRTGDTIVLNCTCISQINGNWVGPNRSSSKTDRLYEENLIPYTEGFKVNTKLNIPNINVVGGYKNKTCNLMIKEFSINDEGIYKCQYVENHIANNHVYKVLLKRPPTNLKITNETEKNTLQVVEGSMLQLVCSVQSGKPKEILQWITNTTVIKEGGQNGTITYTLNASLSDHMKIFICSAFNEALDHPITKQVQLDVLDPPGVSIDTTESQNKITLKCQASSDPGTYEFAKWEHLSQFGKHIRYIGNTQNGTLVLEKNNYQNSGIYKCRVKIGVPDMNGEIYQKELVVVDYKGPPVFVSNNSLTWFAQYPKDAKIILKVFSSSKITSGLIRKIEKGHKEEEQKAFKSIRSFIQSTCRESLAFYNVIVLVECIELTFEIAMAANDNVKSYTVEVCNTFNCSSLEVAIISANNDIRYTFPHDLCWIIMGSLVGGIIIICVCSHIYCYLKRANTCSSNIHQITPADNYDEVETINYNNAIFDHVHTVSNMNNDSTLSIIEDSNILLRTDVVSSDDSSSIKQPGDGYENPYQAINTFDIDMHHYSSIVSCNYQNTIIFPLSGMTKSPNPVDITMDSLTNPWLVIYKRK